MSPPHQKPKTTFFKSPADLRKWFEKHHLTATELRVGYYKKGSGKPSITWSESVAQALCFGWIDGIRHSIDDVSYAIRFTPRRAGSIWSTVNIKLARQLKAAGLMQPAGLRAFEARKENKSGIYSYEQRRDQLDEPYASKLKRNKEAWNFFQSRAPSYRKAAYWWIVSAKKEETRLRRLEKLIDDCANRRPCGHLISLLKDAQRQVTAFRKTTPLNSASGFLQTSPWARSA